MHINTRSFPPPFLLPKRAQLTLKELRARARRLRIAVAGEADLAKIVDVFSDGFMDQDAFIEHSHATDDARFAEILGPDGPLGIKFPGETFRAGCCYVRELELFHAPLISERRMGFAFQFAGERQGVIALYRMGDEPMTDLFRYSVLCEQGSGARQPLVMTKGGQA